MTIPDATTALQALAPALFGELLFPGNPEFTKATQTFSLSPVRDTPVPAAVVQPRGVRDVQTIVKFARAHGFEIAVKSGGHSPRVDCVCHGGIVIDLAFMRGCSVDLKSKTAWAQGGCRLGDVDSATAAYNLAAPLGLVPVTGMGLAIGGGYGHMSHAFGSAAQNIVEFELVTAAGDVVRASADENADLFWGCRGAASAFGVVTGIKFQLFDVSKMYGGVVMFADDEQLSAYRKALAWATETAKTQSKIGLTAVSTYLHPSMSPSPDPLTGFMVALWDEEQSVEEKEALLAGLRACGNVIQDGVGKMSYYDLQMAMLPMYKEVPPHYSWWTSIGLTGAQVTPAVLDKFVELLAQRPPGYRPMSIAPFELYGGKMKEADAPLGFKQFDWQLSCLAFWFDGADTPAHLEFQKRFKSEMEAVAKSVGEYVNYNSSDTTVASIKAATFGGQANVDRLMALKATWDPDCAFKNCALIGRLAPAAAK